MSLELCSLKNHGSFTSQAIKSNFDDLHQPLGLLQAKAEAGRCLYCFDAPCIKACPTSIDVPTFIHQIRTGSLMGSAKTILSQNIMGGTCARACPTEVLCEQVCVLNVSCQQPVKIGALQRFAVDHLLTKNSEHPFSRAKLSGKHIAVIGAGPAGLSCAHRAAMLGHEVTIFEAKNKPGGLNEFGLAAYKMIDDFAQKEVRFLLQIGGINIEYGQSLGDAISLSSLRNNFDAVFIGVGLNSSKSLGIENEDDHRIIDALKFIASLRQTKDKSTVIVGKNVIVIGGGNTAIDAAIQARRLGAENVTLMYRRGEEMMNATKFEIDLARQNGVNLRFWSTPKAFVNNETMAEVVFECTKIKDNQLITTGEFFTIPTDMVLKAIGQNLNGDIFSEAGILGSKTSDPVIQKGKIVVDENYASSVIGVFAGGDCIESGEDLTVQAVQDGKQAAVAIDSYLSGNKYHKTLPGKED